MLRAVALVGPTAAGKSELALDLAERLNAPIVVCDSVQVYCGLDIGSAKPSPQDRARVPHAMIDCCRLPDRFSAERWAEGARDAIRAWNAEGKVPLVVGGAGLYLRALLEGLAPIPAEDPEVRARLQQELKARGVRALHAELAQVDPALAARLAPTDTQRVLRALGVWRSTGRPLSFWQRQRAQRAPIDCPVFVLDLAREPLYRRIEARFYAMLDAGWLNEVRWLASLSLPEDHPAARAVGYRQLLAAVRGATPLDAAIRQGIVATRRYAKRQRTWFRHQVQAAAWGEAAEIAPALARALQRQQRGLR